MTYRQITSEQRYTLGVLRRQGFNQSQIAKALGFHRSTISRELKRNCCAYDGAYRPSKASERTSGRRSRSRRNSRFDEQNWRLVKSLLALQWSPEQIAGRLKAQEKLSISHETIYRRIWRDQRTGGALYRDLRGAPKQRRKRYGAQDSRGRLAGKRHIDERPKQANERSEFGHWEIDTVMGDHASRHCIVTLNERQTGLTLIGKLPERTKEALNTELLRLMRGHGGPFKTITADNGTEFHGYEVIEKATNVKFYFARPYHSWERGSNENTNGLIRQYLPKRKSMSFVNQNLCDAIANRLNTRPRKRLDYKTPLERLYEK